MSRPLAVVAPQIGARSETFIRRHMEELLPSGTVVVVRTAEPPYAGHWTVPGPLLNIGDPDPSLGRRARGARPPWSPRRRASADGLDGARWFLREHGTQVLLAEYLDVALPWLDVARELGLRFFAHAHGYDVSERLRDPVWREAYLRLNEADGVITMSEFSRDRLVQLGLAPERTHAIPYGVDVSDTRPARPTGGRVRCLAVGRFVPKKAPILTLDAFRRALDEGADLQLDYIGDGELLPAADQFVRAFGLQERVTLHGTQPSDVVRGHLAEADLFVQHSEEEAATGDSEGMPVAILEAMAQALPVVSTRHAGIPEAVADGVTGYLVDEGDSAAMGERIAALARDPEKRLAFGVAGWSRAREHFSWPRERQRLLEVLGLEAADGAAH